MYTTEIVKIGIETEPIKNERNKKKEINERQTLTQLTKKLHSKICQKTFAKGKNDVKEGAILLQFLLQIPSICLSCELLRSEPAFAR